METLQMDRAAWDALWPGEAGSWWLSTYPGNLSWLTEERRCLQCSHRFERGWLHPSGQSWPNSVAVNIDVLWHWQDTHGFPREELIGMVASVIGFKADL
jgi:hypothetical protein